MLLNFFYEELYIGEKNKCYSVASELKKQNIKYKIKSSSSTHHNFTPFNSSYTVVGERNGQNRKTETVMHYLYVHKKDLDLAKVILNEVVYEKK